MVMYGQIGGIQSPDIIGLKRKAENNNNKG